MSRHTSLVVAACGLVMITTTVPAPFAQQRPTAPPLSPEFISVFDGRTLKGWTPRGGDWKSDRAHIVGNGSTGFLALDRKFQDGRLSFWFRCGDCEAGVLLRGVDSAGRTNGLFVSLAASDLGTPYMVTLDAIGAETDRQPIVRQVAAARGDTGNVMAPPAGRGAAASAALRSNDWNFVELALRGSSLTGTINGTRIDGGGRGGIAIANLKDFGFAGFKAGGTDVRFRAVALEDFATRRIPTGQLGAGFEMRRVMDQFYSETAEIGDFNRDGKGDVVAGPFWYEGPSFSVAHAIAATSTASTSSGYPPWADTFVADYNNDGWPDIVSHVLLGSPINLYLNPKGESRHWEKIVISAAASSEIVPVCALFGDGRNLPVTIVGGVTSNGRIGYYTPDAADIRKPWTFHPVSEPARPPRTERPGPSQHGLGCGDVNGDGRVDLLNGNGWWEQPAQVTDANWTFHTAPFDALREDDRRDGGGGARMFTDDVNGDGRPDVVTSLAAHGWGLAWFEQRPDGSWMRHLIMTEPALTDGTATVAPISELHAITLVDLDGDGLKDIVTGKRWWSHGDLYNEIGFQAPPTLYWFKLTRTAGQATFTPRLIHDNSGVGNSIAAGDVDGDGRPDIVTAARHGVFVFLNRLGRRP